jgi:hypothetical protein
VTFCESLYIVLCSSAHESRPLGRCTESIVRDIEAIYVLVQEQSRDVMRGSHAYLINLVRRSSSRLSSFKSRLHVASVQPQCRPQT